MKAANARMDDCLSTRDGHLFFEECDTVELVSQQIIILAEAVVELVPLVLMLQPQIVELVETEVQVHHLQ